MVLNYKVKITIILLSVIFAVIISIMGIQQLVNDTLITEKYDEYDILILKNYDEYEIRPPVNISEDRFLAEYLVDAIIEKYDSGQTIQSLNGDPLGFTLLNDEIRYVFILDEDLTAIAHYIPGAIGATFESINAVRTFDQVSRDLESEGQTWIHYEKYNPNTNKIESKTSLLKLHNGIVFGSGFYNE